MGALSAQSAEAATVMFVPGTYSLASVYPGPAVDTLVLSVSDGIASFVLSGMDNATFTVPDDSTPTGAASPEDGYDPYFYIPESGITTSWDTSAYPYLTFYSTIDLGGFAISEGEGDSLDNLIDLFQSTPGTAQLFVVGGVPEPDTWAMMIAGFGVVGTALRLRTRVVRAAA